MWNNEISMGVFSLPIWLFAAINSFVFGTLTFLGTRKSLLDCQLTPGKAPVRYAIAAVLLTVSFVASVLILESQHTPVVLPAEAARSWRLIYHLVLISLLLMITATDARSYYILDWTCWLGMAVGVAGATLSGEFQLVHVWVDWNQEVPQLHGPYIPAWLAEHQHLHGLVWSLSGLLGGVMVTWLTRRIASSVLGIEALGTGDILLMGMIGAFLGWQPTLIAFALAPVFALFIGGAVRAVSNRPALPYGPFLAAGALTTLFAWRPIWMLEVPLTLAPDPDRDSIFAIRRFFGDWVSLLVAGCLTGVLFVTLLSLLRLYKSIDFKQHSSTIDH